MMMYGYDLMMMDPVWFDDDVPLYVLILTTAKSHYLEVGGTIFNKSKLPEVQINLHFG